MKKRTIKIFVIILSLYQFSCNSKVDMPLTRIYDNKKFGFIDTLGKIVIPATYDLAGGFNDGLAIAGSIEKYGFINNKGEFVIDPKYQFNPSPLDITYVQKNPDNVLGDLIATYSFNNGLALYYDTTLKLFGYINIKGEVIIKPKFRNATKFRNGFAVVDNNIGTINYDSSIKMSLINVKGDIIIDKKFDRLTRPSKNFLTGTIISDANPGVNISAFVLNTNGQIINSILPNNNVLTNEFSGGYCRGINVSYGFDRTSFIYDSTGKTFNKSNGEIAYFDDVIINRGHFFWIKVDGKYSWFKLSTENQIVAPDNKVYDEVKGGFDVNSIAAVKYYDENTGKSLFGFIDTLGNFIIPPRFENASNFQNGLAYVKLKSFAVTINGYINKKGELVWSREQND